MPTVYPTVHGIVGSKPSWEFMLEDCRDWIHGFVYLVGHVNLVVGRKLIHNSIIYGGTHTQNRNLVIKGFGMLEVNSARTTK